MAAWSVVILGGRNNFLLSLVSSDWREVFRDFKPNGKEKESKEKEENLVSSSCHTVRPPRPYQGRGFVSKYFVLNWYYAHNDLRKKYGTYPVY